MTLMPPRWRQAIADRRRALKAGQNHLRALDDPEQTVRTAAWDALFGYRRGDHSPDRAPHGGLCGRCGAAVETSAAGCPTCGAAWVAGDVRRRRHARLRFIGSWTVLAASIGWLVGKGAVHVALWLNPSVWTEDGWYAEFLSFVQTYAWFTSAILIFLWATYRYEHRYADEGRWQPPADGQ
jgi:hypothetical protein